MTQKSDISLRSIYVENIPLTTSANQIQRLFAKFGTVKSVDLPTFDSGHPICRGLPKPKSKGYAFVEFSSIESAQKACQFFNDLGYILAAAATVVKHDEQYFGGTDLIETIEKNLSVIESSECDHSESSTKFKESIITNLEFRKLLLVRVMTRHQFQELSQQFTEKRFQSLVKAAKMLIVSS